MRDNIDKIITKFIEMRDLLEKSKESLRDMTDGEVLDEVYDMISDISRTYRKVGSVAEFKYFIGQRVWLIYGNVVTSRDVEYIKCEIDNTSNGIKTYEKYQLNGLGDRWFDVSQLFASKEELIKSL